MLWLEHGQQVAFSDEVDLYCDAYDEFLHSRRLPQNRQEAVEMSRTLQLRFLQQQAAAARTEAEKLQAILEEGSSDAAVQAAVNVLKKQRPELLR